MMGTIDTGEELGSYSQTFATIDCNSSHRRCQSTLHRAIHQCVMGQSIPPQRLSDLPRDECIRALHQRAADARAQWQASRSAQPSFWSRLFG
ncbi:hypothetical protein [uncultured Sphingomonas sp.]|uniref:hypothetical protein n=1 Tax=uncultured Sphingomonas sp. TaxID=158754 RepID=UPI0025F9D401|nr:hypothetical protein [uncultured Sphingomonas sp.]